VDSDEAQGRGGETSATEFQRDGAPSPLLTALCSSGGCAAKYAGVSLHALLGGLAIPSHRDVVVGLEHRDDAAVLQLSDGTGLVFTVDFFPPIVDDPFLYGRISANNALSDIYAMGGRPVMALSVAAFPEDLQAEVLQAIIAGAARQCELAGATLAGGHTIRDREPRFGLAAVGFVHLSRMWLKSGAEPGDALVLTKPLGSGLVVTAQRRGRASERELHAATQWMLASNAIAADVAHGVDVHAATDISGFGLLGHGLEIANRSGVRLVFDAPALPLMDGARRLASEGIRTSADESNHALVSRDLHVGLGVDVEALAIALDPQTSGGLLIALPPACVRDLDEACKTRNVFMTRIGSVERGSGVDLASQRTRW
jgi:selenide,water dikinase